jgi:pimeloyl-ACP methyl ester carboxylesterase
MSKDYTLETGEKQKLAVTAYWKGGAENKPCLIYVHGFKGFKDWGFVPYLAEYFAAKGFFVITFNFSHNGIGENLTEFTELDKFAENTYSREISELNEIIDAYKRGFFENSGMGKITLLGHSRGGGISLAAARKRGDISAVLLWASISNFDRYTERQKKEWRKKGYMEALNTRTKQVMRLNAVLLDDIEKNSADLLNLEKAVRELKKPLFIGHGEQDLTVPINEGEVLYSWADKKMTEFAKIPNAGHTFNISHPFNGPSEKLHILLEKSFLFLKKYLFS